MCEGLNPRWLELAPGQRERVNTYINTILAEQIPLDDVIKPGREIVETRRKGPITYQHELVRCGKDNCRTCAKGSGGHGPYWYGYWRVPKGKVKSKYIGKEFKELTR